MNYYDYLDNNINHALNADIDFSCLVSADLYKLEAEAVNLFFKRYELIKEYQKISLDLFNASLKGDFDPELATLVINELPKGQGWKFHQKFTANNLQTPVFFRTDEVIPGKFSEIQCPGSAWGLYEQVFQFVNEFKKDYGECKTFPMSLSSNFAGCLKKYLPREPVVHHLLDNASIPAGIRFFIQQVRKHGIKYFGYDKNVTPYNCNFIRAHAFAGLLSDNHFKRRMEECRNGELFYDLPPSILFDEKMPLIFPFWEKTKHYFSDAVRDMFPYTQLIRPEGFTLEDGTEVSLEDFMKLPRNQRNYYIKYAGSDLDLNWGSKGVFFAATLSQKKGQEIFKKITRDFQNKKYWIIQNGYSQKEEISFINRENIEEKGEAHSKFSGFYGPQGLMGILVLHRSFYKVHGAENAIATIVK
ncbi:MAG: hypothetical protein U9N77_13370 [Thermodesulfobacteriota bacterium]|nr:hypothetical protein [Thermodesulfobacteriota bacterium]